MNLEEYEERISNYQQSAYLKEHITVMIELFSDLTDQDTLSYYKYEYEYNEFFQEISLNKNQDDDNEVQSNKKKYKILLKDKKYVYGYLLLSKKIVYSPIVKKLLKKIVLYLANEKELYKKLYENEIPFHIYIFHDELDAFANNLKVGLEGLFNTNVVVDTNIEKYFDAFKSKNSKHIILFLINDVHIFKEIENKIKYLNEMIIIIGPNDHHISMYCGRLGIDDYISINEFKVERLKSLIVNKRSTILNKNKYGNKIIALAGISGGVGTTTIAMNISNMIAKTIPYKNLLYIDLSTTKAISNLFLEKNPLPNKTIIDLINASEFNLENNLENGLVKIRENFYSINGIQKHIDADHLEKDVFIQKFLEYISSCSEHFNFIIIDLGTADASNLKSTIYDLANELWVVSEMNLPHISKLKTFYTLLKRAGLQDKITFISNRYDSQNTLALNDVASILNMNEEDKGKLDNFKIPNDYKVLGKYWNYCELVSDKEEDCAFLKKLHYILQEKNLLEYDRRKPIKKKSFMSSLFSGNKK